MSLYRDQAVVLRSWKLGEADRIISLHTHENGKVRGVAKGIRRTRSKFGGRLEPLSHVAVQLYRGRGDLDTITQVETITRFPSLRHNPERMGQAQAMLEAVDGVAQDREADRALHVMLVRALVTLEQRQNAFVLPAFFLKLLTHEGLAPQLDSCLGCGRADSLVAFDVDDGGVLCRQCRRGRPISTQALAVMRQILSGQLSVVLADEALHAALDLQHELQLLATALVERHLERRLRSIAVLEQA
ncbi:MAG: DNA repair protein RecO [Acidimicrobiia bacterium]|nr:DNA repair protein RecO [Acidimicrobiia bacterium]MCY4456827.1 DNA repair protein RecO [Acidimicrobiaceae bacterium]